MRSASAGSAGRSAAEGDPRSIRAGGARSATRSPPDRRRSGRRRISSPASSSARAGGDGVSRKPAISPGCAPTARPAPQGRARVPPRGPRGARHSPRRPETDRRCTASGGHRRARLRASRRPGGRRRERSRGRHRSAAPASFRRRCGVSGWVMASSLAFRQEAPGESRPASASVGLSRKGRKHPERGACPAPPGRALS